MSRNYEALTPETLANRIAQIPVISQKVGGSPTKWKVKEVGDGNLNLVFILEGEENSIIIKQALPYVRLVGESWPLPLERAFFEYNALIRQQERDPGVVPKVYYFDRGQALIAMEYFHPHKILRGKFINGDKVEKLGETLGAHCARIAFRGSDLHMKTSQKKADVALFQGNVSLCGITEDLIFTDPYFQAEMNNHTEGLGTLVKQLRSDTEMKVQVQQMLQRFSTNTETMCHGDLHSGSIMCTNTETKVIDPEFGFYGPMGFDLGMLIANFLMAYLSQPAHRGKDELEDYQEWILDIIGIIFRTFCSEFATLWDKERTGILFPKKMFEDQGQSSQKGLENIFNHIGYDVIAVCGIEMHRRCLSLAHNADFELIENIKIRAKLEARNLMLGRELILNQKNLNAYKDIEKLARNYNEKDFL